MVMLKDEAGWVFLIARSVEKAGGRPVLPQRGVAAGMARKSVVAALAGCTEAVGPYCVRGGLLAHKAQSTLSMGAQRGHCRPLRPQVQGPVARC
jgi:hypothetical protein